VGNEKIALLLSTLPKPCLPDLAGEVLLTALTTGAGKRLVRQYIMLEPITPRGRRLLAVAMITPALLLCLHYGAPLLNSEVRHLRAVDEHIRKIDPQWNQFRAQHPGLEQVTLFAYPGGDGLFGAYGYVAYDDKIRELRKFMESTSPPRPVFLDSVHVAGSKSYEVPKILMARTAAANRCQPVCSETNQTPVAAVTLPPP
jgi:hypothetical protein